MVVLGAAMTAVSILGFMDQQICAPVEDVASPWPTAPERGPRPRMLPIAA
jgi:hypothetical protein